MNCKPGDLAVVVHARVPSNIGLLVLVIEPDKSRMGYWVVETLGRGISTLNQRFEAGAKLFCADHRLRPIRPNDGEDEMIRIAGKPHDAHKSTSETA